MNAKLFFGLFAGSAMALAMTGCSSDEPGGVQNDKAEKTVYLRVAIADVNTASRAENNSDNFLDVEGTTAENKIESLQFRFFDAAGNPVHQTSETDYTFTDATTDQGAPSVDRVKEAVVQVNLSQGQGLPAYVLVFANSVDWSSISDETKMNGYRNVEREGYRDNKGNFVMNNSVYYGTDAVSGQNNVKISGTPIKAGQLFTSKADAATGESVVDIYIERRAARVDVKIAANGAENNVITPYAVGGYTLTFTPSAWTVTADAKTMYSIKRFATDKPEAGKPEVIPSMTDVQNYLGTWTGWNDEPLSRSYWACSPSFYATNFPRVSDNIVDIASADDATKTGAGEVVAPFALKYYSFNQINDGTTGSAIAANGAIVTRYALENTMGKEAFASLNPNAAAPSVLLTGKYTITAGTTALAANTSFAIWHNELYFIGTVPNGALEGAQTIEAAMLAGQQIVATDKNGTMLRAARAGVAVQHPAANVRNGNAIAEERMTLQLTTLPTAGNMLYYKPVGSDTWEAIDSEEEMVYVNRQLAGQLNYAKAYTQGAAYFGIPIKHLRATEDTTNSPFTVTDGKETTDWTKVRVGDFGLVRNHVYTINITGITGLGDGVLDLNYPIITPMNSYNYYIKYSLKVLNWRIVPEQGVIL